MPIHPETPCPDRDVKQHQVSKPLLTESAPEAVPQPQETHDPSGIVHPGDCLEMLRVIDPDYIDAVITDPPYGIAFMGKDWDRAVPPVEVWKECLRVLKPGAWCLVMSGARQDVLSQMIVRLGEAGFNTGFSSIYWTYATGFPKALNIGKQVPELKGMFGGFQPKPAVEIVIVAQKPLTERTYVKQAMANGKGGTWIGDCRVPFTNDVQGRYPANLLVSDNILGDHSRFFSLDAWADTHPFCVCPMASKSEKDRGCEHMPRSRPDTRTATAMGTFQTKGVRPGHNPHPTVKPLKLMRYLITLTTQPGDVVLDPYAGSGTTLVAAKQLGRCYSGAEKTEEYVPIIKARLTVDGAERNGTEPRTKQRRTTH